jgi:DNA-binding transcriptional LysR family regulator
MEPHITTTLNLNVDMLDELERKLVEKEINFAIGVNFNNHPDLECIPILKTIMTPVIHSDFFKNTNGSLEHLRQYPQIIVKSSAKASTRKILGAVKDMKQWFTTDMSMKEKLILNGLGWGRLPRHQIIKSLNDGTLKEIKHIKEISPNPVEISLIRNTTKTMGPNTKRLWNYLANMPNL